MRSADGRFTVDVPAYWAEAPQQVPVGKSDIACADTSNALWAAVWNEAKEDVAVSNLDQYVLVVSQQLEAELKDVEFLQDPTAPAPRRPREFVFAATIGTARLVFVRFEETASHYCQVRTWAPGADTASTRRRCGGSWTASARRPWLTKGDLTRDGAGGNPLWGAAECVFRIRRRNDCVIRATEPHRNGRQSDQ